MIPSNLDSFDPQTYSPFFAGFT